LLGKRERGLVGRAWGTVEEKRESPICKTGVWGTWQGWKR